MNPNQLADDLSAALEGVFNRTHRDRVEALIAQRGAISHEKRTRLLAALHQVQTEAINVLAALSRDAAW